MTDTKQPTVAALRAAQAIRDAQQPDGQWFHRPLELLIDEECGLPELIDAVRSAITNHIIDEHAGTDNPCPYCDHLRSVLAKHTTE